MANAPACPKPQELERLLTGQTPFPDVERLAQHLESCDRCADTVQGLKAEDTLVELIRAQAAAAGRADDPLLKKLVERFKHQRPAARKSGIAGPAAQGQSDKELYDFLSPPQGPGELGRLGPYRVLKILGAGGMGVVFQAEDLHLSRPVALKAMKPGLAASGTAKQRFLREAKATAALKHDHIVTIYQVGEDRGVPFLAMEFLEGAALDDWLKKGRQPTLGQILRVGREVALGLAVAHERGMIHRDIKPANIWLEAPKGRVKILDFGLARSAREDIQLTQSGAIVGTPAFMAPEQATAQKVDHRVDLFSLGCVLYRLCAGRLPFRGDNTMAVLMALATEVPQPVREVNPQIPQVLADLVTRLLAKAPDDRPASAKEVVQAIQGIERQVASGQILDVPAGTGGKSVAVHEAITMSEAPVAGQAKQKSAGKGGPRRQMKFATLAMLLLAVLGIGGYLLAPAIFRVQTDQGTLVIETDDPDVQVLITQNGKQVEIIDTKTRKQITLKEGKYELALAGNKDGLKLETDKLTLKRDERPVVRVWREERVASRPPTTQKGTATQDTAKAVGEVRRFEGHTAPVRGVAVLPDGQHVLSADSAGHIILWNFMTGKEVRRFEPVTKTVRETLLCMALSPDGSRALSGYGISGNAMRLRLWDVVSGKDIRQINAPPDSVTSVAFSPDGRNALSGREKQGPPGGAWLWDLETGKELMNFEHPRGDDSVNRESYVWSVAFSPDGCTAATGGRAKTLCLWDVTTGKQLNQIPAKAELLGVAFSPSGGQVYAACSDWTIRQWDVASGAERHRLSGHTNRATRLAVFPDGNRVLSGGADRTVRLWEVNTNRQVHCFEGHTDGVNCVALSPDGLYAISGSVDKTARVWRLPASPGTITPQPGKSPPLAVAPFDEKQAKEHQKRWAEHLGVPVEFTNSVGMKFVLIPAGEFNMGTEGGPQQTVTITKAFYAGVCEVMQAEFIKVLGTNPASRKGDLRPVESVNWDMATDFCNKLSQLAAEKGAGRTYRLPTEGQWEYACRAGTRTAFFYGDTLSSKLANFSGEAGKPVNCGLYPPNAWGLHDMHGNVWEWCIGGTPVIRGGGAMDQGPVCRSASRSPRAASLRHDHIGFRVVCSIPDKPAQPMTQALPPSKGVDELWIKSVAALPSTAKQVEAVTSMLCKLNPDFDPAVKHSTENGIVSEIELATDKIRDISPLRAYPGLKRLRLSGSAPGKGRVDDLASVRGLQLVELNCRNNPIADMTPLSAMKLTTLDIALTEVSDLRSLKGMPLASLNLEGCRRVRELSPLQGMPLASLNIKGCEQVGDLTPLKGMPLTTLNLGRCSQLRDLTPLKGLSLTWLDIGLCREVQDLTPIQGMPLIYLHLQETAVRDLSPLKGMELQEVQLRPKDITKGMDILRQMKSLKVIRMAGSNQGYPPADFWKKYDAGEFTK